MGLALLVATTGCTRTIAQRATAWTVAETRNIRLLTDAGPEAAHHNARTLQRLREGLVRAFYDCGTGLADRQVEVTMFAHRADLALVTDRTGAQLTRVDDLAAVEPSIVTGGGGRLTPYVRQTLLHELTHELVGSCFPDAPTWLNEGLAGFFETLTRDADGVVTLGEPKYVFDPGRGVVRSVYARDRWRRVIPTRMLVPPSRLTGLTRDQFQEDDDERVVANYASAWALVHMLELGSSTEVRQVWHDYLVSLRSGGSSLGLGGLVYSGRLDARLVEYVNRDRHPQLTATRHINEPGEPRTRPMGATEMHLHWVGLLLREAGDLTRGEAAAVARQHLAMATEDPDFDARGYVLWAQLERDPGLTQRILRRAIERGPTNRAVLRAQLVQVIRGDRRVTREELGQLLSGFMRAIGSTATPSELAVRSRAFLLLGRTNTAARDALRAVRADPTFWQARARLCARAGGGRRVRGGHPGGGALTRVRGARRKRDQPAPHRPDSNAPPSRPGDSPVTVVPGCAMDAAAFACVGGWHRSCASGGTCLITSPLPRCCPRRCVSRVAFSATAAARPPTRPRASTRGWPRPTSRRPRPTRAHLRCAMTGWRAGAWRSRSSSASSGGSSRAASARRSWAATTRGPDAASTASTGAARSRSTAPRRWTSTSLFAALSDPEVVDAFETAPHTYRGDSAITVDVPTYLLVLGEQRLSLIQGCMLDLESDDCEAPDGVKELVRVSLELGANASMRCG